MPINSYRENHIKGAINHAQNKFANFGATLTKHGPISIIDWNNKNGSKEYRIRFTFDHETNHMYITGDLGTAVFQYWTYVTIFDLAKITSIDYFMEKLVCSTDDYIYSIAYASEVFKKELGYHCDLEEEYYQDILNELIDNYDNGVYLPDDLKEKIDDIDPNNFEWIYDAGKLPSTRVILWLQAIKMAAKDLKEQFK